MTCINFGNIIVCYNKSYRLRLYDGRYVFMEWHEYLGPTFFRDKWCSIEIENWWEYGMYDIAIKWFVNRGKKA